MLKILSPFNAAEDAHIKSDGGLLIMSAGGNRGLVDETRLEDEEEINENEISVEGNNDLNGMEIVTNENTSFLQSSNDKKCRKSRSEDRIETLEDDLSTGTEETHAVSIVLQDTGVDNEDFVSAGADFPIAVVANNIIENDVPTACHAEEIDIEHNDETVVDSDNPKMI